MPELLLPIILIFIIVFLYKAHIKNRENTRINKEAGEVFLEKNKAKEGIQVTDSGLQFLILRHGKGESHPTATSTVKVRYHGTLIDGSVFDSSYDRQEPAVFKLNKVIPGWTEGLQLMLKGEKRRLFIPSALAYGDSAVSIIASGSTLIFEIELIDFE